MRILLVAVLVLACTAFVHAKRFDPHPHVPARWTMVELADPEAPVELMVAVKQQNLALLEERTWRVSDPRDSLYGQYLSKDEVNAMIAPSPESVEAVSSWLSAHLHEDDAVNWMNDWVEVKTTARVAAAMLHNTFHTFADARRPSLRIVRSMGGYSVPASVAEHIDLIGGVSDFPETMRAQWNVPAEETATGAAAEAVIEYMLPGDGTLGSFFLPVCPNGEVTLDAQQPCSDQGEVLSGVTQRVTQLTNFQEHRGTLAQTTCKPCTEWTSRQATNCQSANSANGYADDTVYCNTPILVDLENYYPISYSIQLSFESVNGSEPTDGPVVEYTARPLYLGEFVTPDVLLERYQVPPGEQIVTNPASSQSVAEFSFQFYSESELQYFFQQMNVIPTPVELVGLNVEDMPGSEATLDIQYIMGVAQNATTVFWSSGLTFMKWVVNLNNSDNPPLVNSVSYGADEENVGKEVMTRMDTEFQKSANLGLTLLFAAGDNGVLSGDPSHEACTVAEHFVPSFPTGSAYITAVGATQFSTQLLPFCSATVIGLPATCDTVGEIACSISTGSRITTGGGFSDHYPRPSYQDEIVQFYLDNFVGDIPSNYYNASNRAYPDISACGRNFMVYVDGDWDPVDGTSASTPTVAGIFTLVNQNRLNAGLPPIGFVNPALYQGFFSNGRYTKEYFDAYWDIQMGDNKCGVQGQECCPYGFESSFGWDATTGMGTPKNLLHYLSSVGA